MSKQTCKGRQLPQQTLYCALQPPPAPVKTEGHTTAWNEEGGAQESPTDVGEKPHGQRTERGRNLSWFSARQSRDTRLLHRRIHRHCTPQCVSSPALISAGQHKSECAISIIEHWGIDEGRGKVRVEWSHLLAVREGIRIEWRG